MGDESSYSFSSPGHPGGITILDSQEAEALANNLETHFQPVTILRSRQLLRWSTWRWSHTS
jgi:hypothetical protein